MAVVTVRLDDATRGEVERYAVLRGISVSELIREALDKLMSHREALLDDPDGDGEESGSDAVEVRSLRPVERRTLMMLHEILAHLDPSDEVDEDGEDGGLRGHARRVEVLREGFTAEYSDDFGWLSQEMSIKECELLWDLLDMFRFLKASVEALGEEQVASIGEHAVYALTFRGFDLNDARESRLLMYARHLLRTGRWEDLAEYFDRKHERGNSHARLLPTYLRMHQAFKPVWRAKLRDGGRGRDGYLLTRDELAEIYAAWWHPERHE